MSGSKSGSGSPSRSATDDDDRTATSEAGRTATGADSFRGGAGVGAVDQTPASHRPLKWRAPDTPGGDGAGSGGAFSPGGAAAHTTYVTATDSGSKGSGTEPYDASGSPGRGAAAPFSPQAVGTSTSGTEEGSGGLSQVEGSVPPDLQLDFFLDEEEEMARHPFPIPPGELIAKARKVLAVGVYRWEDLSDDFEFSAPFIGPMGPDAFRSTMATMALDEAFPDLAPRYHHFRADPFRPHCTHRGTFKGNLPFGIKPTGRVIEEPPQTASLSFNAAGQVCGYTMGYVMDRGVGNTDGLGGAFGLMWALGCPLPAPEGRPWSPSLQLRLVNSGRWALKAAAYLIDRTASLVVPSSWLARHSRNTM
ncbi:hypothetical protein GPECTOR_52g55 [Gonium pectorale]|uniref:Uncharacterized protein n=1 Tax=Gonium pectorale TaxID=33097 RepID=A0A150G711_GONPE|nr:hypothetical protein GPECTOR_52g55 [Gonium pectorale]|eukprot:KXZ45656.1 hypothetical protein GPECTOR_52g55 [Gonium pectorale]